MSSKIGFKRIDIKLPGFKRAIVTSPPCEKLICVLYAMRWHDSLSNELLVQVVYLTNNEASTVLCSVVKHAGSRKVQNKCRGKHETQSSVLPHFLSALPLPKRFTTGNSTVTILVRIV